jgi:hypothetical protein
VLPIRDLLNDFTRRFPQAAPHDCEGVVPLIIPAPEHLFSDGITTESLPRVVRQQQILENAAKT